MPEYFLKDKKAAADMLFSKRYPELDLARAFAITLVMLYHFNAVVFNLPKESYFTRFFRWGYHGVDLFFVLSGFLIGGKIIEENILGGFSFKRFYLNRFYRIFPPYYFSILVFIVLYSIGKREFALLDVTVLKDVLVHIFYLQDYIDIHRIYGGLYWSLAVEEQFYILIPVLLYLLLRGFKGHLGAWLSAMAVLAISLKLILYDPSKDWGISFYLPFHARFDNLLFGVLAASIFISYKDRIKDISNKWKLLIISAALAMLVLTFFYGNFAGGYFNSCWQFTLTGLAFSALMLLAASSSCGRFIPFQRGTGAVAKYSYGMYLYHTVLVVPVIKIAGRLFTIDNTKTLNFFVLFAAYFLTVIFISSIIYRFLDRPCMAYRKKMQDRWE